MGGLATMAFSYEKLRVFRGRPALRNGSTATLGYYATHSDLGLPKIILRPDKTLAADFYRHLAAAGPTIPLKPLERWAAP